MKRQPLRNLRKTTIVVIAVFLGFLIHRVVAFCLEDVAIRDDSTKAELIDAQEGVVCSHMVDGRPFGGVDSVFNAGTRLYFYTKISGVSASAEDTLYHIWFNGLDTLQKAICHLNGEACYTTLEPKLVQEGEWSTDFVAGRKLLLSRQFKVVVPKR